MADDEDSEHTFEGDDYVEAALEEVAAIERAYARTTRWEACSTMGHAGSDGARSHDSDLDQPLVVEDMTPVPEVHEDMAPVPEVHEDDAAGPTFTGASGAVPRSKKPTSLPPRSRRRDPPPPLKRDSLQSLRKFGAYLQRGDLPAPVKPQQDLRGNSIIGGGHIHSKKNLRLAWYSGSHSDARANRGTGIRHGRPATWAELHCDEHADGDSVRVTEHTILTMRQEGHGDFLVTAAAVALRRPEGR